MNASDAASVRDDDDFEPWGPRQLEWWRMRFWFTLRDLLRFVRRPFLLTPRITKAELVLCRMMARCMRRGFGWTD